MYTVFFVFIFNFMKNFNGNGTEFLSVIISSKVSLWLNVRQHEHDTNSYNFRVANIKFYLL